MSFDVEQVAALAIGALLAVLAIVGAGQPGDYGLGPVAFHWLLAITAGLGFVQMFLKSIRQQSTPPADPPAPVAMSANMPGSNATTGTFPAPTVTVAPPAP